MDKPLRVLLIEDSEDDAVLILRELRKAGYTPVSERVETESTMKWLYHLSNGMLSFRIITCQNSALQKPYLFIENAE